MSALAIFTPRAGYYQQTSIVGNLFSLKMLASGGQNPYYWSFTGPSMAIVGGTTGTNYALPFNGWLSCAALTAGADTFTVLVTDNNGATATQSVTITHTASGITFYPLDLTGSPVLNLPTAYASTPYSYKLKIAGGTGLNQVFSIISGALPSGLSLSSTGFIQGTPAASGSIASCVVRCVDSANNNTSVSLYLNIGSQNKVARPAYNTGTAFFVDGNGLLRDPLGYLFTMRGLDRVHYDSDTWAGPTNGGLAYPNAVRVFMFDGQTAAFAANQVQTQYAPNNIFTILTLAGIGSLSPTGTTGQTNPAYVTQATADWNSYYSTLVPVMNSISINIANEWGPSNSTAWRDTYITAVASLRATGYTCPLVIDTGSSGEDIFDIVNYAAAVNNSDPLKNCIFSIHPYAAALPWQCVIAGVTKGNPTVLTLNSNWANFPLNPGASTAGANNFNFEYQITGAAGLAQLNGLQPSDNKTYGSQNNWQVHLTVDSSLWSGNYTPNSATAYIATSTSSRNVDYRYMCSQLAGLRTSGVCSIVGEFGPGNQSGNVLGATQQLNFQETTPGQFISACESYGIGYLSWAWDDHSGTNTLFTPNYFNMVYAVAPGYGKYTHPGDLTAFGLDIVGNPRYGTWARSEPAASYLTVNPQTLPLVQSTNTLFTYVGSFKMPSIFTGGFFSMYCNNGVMYAGGGYHYAGNTTGSFIQCIGRCTVPAITPGSGTWTTPAYDGSNGTAIATSGPSGNDGPSRPGFPTFTNPGPAYPWGYASGDAITGSLLYNGNLYLTGATSFGGTQLGWALAANANCDPTTWGAINQISAGSITNGGRSYAGPMGIVPDLWKPLLGGPAFVSPGKGVSVISTLNIGVGFTVFDPAGISGPGSVSGNTVTAKDLLHYPEQQLVYTPNTTMLSWRSFCGPYPLAYNSTPTLYPSATVSAAHPSGNPLPQIGDTSLTLTAPIPTTDPRYATAANPTGVGKAYGNSLANAFWAHMVYFSSGEKRLCLLKGGSATVPTIFNSSTTYNGSNPAVFLDPVTLLPSPLTQNCGTSTVYYAPLGDNYYQEYDNGALQPFIAPGSRSLIFPMVHTNGFLSPPPEQGFPGCFPGGSASDDAVIAPDTNYYMTMQAIAYDLNDLVSVAQGAQSPWQPTPYAILPWDQISKFGLQTQGPKQGPFCVDAGPGASSCGHGCYDPVTGYYFLGAGQLSHLATGNVVYVWKVNSL